MRTKSPLFGLALLGLFSMLLGACGEGTTTTDQQPIEVVSVIGPLQPINPGGPMVQVTLKNISNETVVSLTASLGISSAGQTNAPFVFNFDVTTSNPLLPAGNVSSTLTLIGAGLADTILYPLAIQGTLQGGATFAYTEGVQIASPLTRNPAPWPGVPVYSDPSSPIVTRLNGTFSIVLPPAPLFGWGWQNNDLSSFSLLDTQAVSGAGNEPNPYGPNAFLFKALKTGTFQITLYVPSKPPQQLELFNIVVNP